MRSLLILAFFCYLIQSPAQTEIKPTKLLTEKYQGIYSNGKNPVKGRIGTIIIYPESDSTVLFYIDLNRGAPSYNMGSLYGSVKIKNDSGTYQRKFDFMAYGCKWKLKFSKNTLKIKTVEEKYDCGFGNAVIADGDFKQISKKRIEYFETEERAKIYFKKSKPEEFYKEPK